METKAGDAGAAPKEAETKASDATAAKPQEPKGAAVEDAVADVPDPDEDDLDDLDGACTMAHRLTRSSFGAQALTDRTDHRHA